MRALRARGGTRRQRREGLIETGVELLLWVDLEPVIQPARDDGHRGDLDQYVPDTHRQVPLVQDGPPGCITDRGRRARGRWPRGSGGLIPTVQKTDVP